MYVYRFLNQQNQVIYVGRTNNIIRRIRQQHFGKNGHLPKECYNETKTVEYAKVASQNDAILYELYYIEKYHPIYNTSDIGGGAFSVELNELPWQVFDFNTDKKTLSKKQLEELVQTVHQELRTEHRYIDKVIDRQDRVSWLDKLTQDERNEYLNMVYSIERYVNNIRDIADKLNTENTNEYQIKKHYTEFSV